MFVLSGDDQLVSFSAQPIALLTRYVINVPIGARINTPIIQSEASFLILMILLTASLCLE